MGRFGKSLIKSYREDFVIEQCVDYEDYRRHCETYGYIALLQGEDRSRPEQRAAYIPGNVG